VLERTPLAEGPAVLVELASPGFVRADVLDVQGRRVANLAAGELGKGATVLHWDRRNAHGDRVAPGIYFARVATPRDVRWARFVVLRP
jgi:hypothetical protein